MTPSLTALSSAIAVTVFALFAALPATARAVASTSSTPSPTITTPTTHSYDDSHPDQQESGSNPALWILGAAAIGLIIIATIMFRAGRPARVHLARGGPPTDGP